MYRGKSLISSLPKYFLLLVMAVFLPACGFQPLYGEHSALSADTPLSGNLVISKIDGHEGQMLKTSLEDLLNPEGLKYASPEYRLDITLAKNLIPAVVRNDGTIQRYDMQIDTKFTLVRLRDKKPLLEGKLKRTGSYNVAVNANFATYEAGQDVIERTLHEIAEDYVLRLSGYFAGKNDK